MLLLFGSFAAIIGEPCKSAAQLFDASPGEMMEFRHDWIRAHLAARYYALRWRSILGNEKMPVDLNWDAMMDFHLEREQDATRSSDMTLLQAAKDIDSAIRLARWGRVSRPELFCRWEDELSQEVGKKVLGV